VLYLSFDEGTGKKVKDQSKYGNHGEIILNTDWVDGKFGSTVKITGEATNCVVIPDSDSLKIESAAISPKGKLTTTWSTIKKQ
jgi:hypothetical protein